MKLPIGRRRRNEVYFQAMCSPWKTNYYILTGPPGAGKTSLLQGLRKQGLYGVGEPARAVLSHQLAIDGPGLPAKNPLLFIQMMLKQSIEDFEEAKARTGPVFFDRGIPDLVAYALRFGVECEEFENAARGYLYNPTVFVLPPRKEIFVNDNERRISFEGSVEFHLLLTQTYERLGYEQILVPFANIETRASFIIQETAVSGSGR